MLGAKNNLLKTNEFIAQSILVKDGNPARYHVKTTSDHLDESESYRKITFGQRNLKKPHKTILMVGETGTGKTALINTMFNYMCGVQREDKVWFEITDDQSDRSSAHGQTSIITVYSVYIQKSSVDLTIIDTPGYRDTRCIGHDKHIAESLLPLIKSKDVPEINAVCFVMKADQNYFSVRQRFILDAIQSLFGKDIGENLVLLFTHSTGSYPTNALTAVKKAQVKSALDEEIQPIYFLFDNCQSDTYDKRDQSNQHQSWDLSYRGMERFFSVLDTVKPKQLKQTSHVLQKRTQLEANIPKLQECFQKTEQKQNELRQSQEALEKLKNNVDYERKVEVQYKVKVDIDPSVAKMAMCCTVCEENCHYPGCWWVADLSWCEMMKNNHCTVCPKKCHYSKHVKQYQIYVTKTKNEKRIDEDLKKKYDDKIDASQSVIDTLKKELQDLEKERTKLVNDAYHYVDGLENIALNSDSLFILLHIDFLIQILKEINEPEKAEKLENIKERAGEEKKRTAEFEKTKIKINKLLCSTRKKPTSV